MVTLSYPFYVIMVFLLSLHTLNMDSFSEKNKSCAVGSILEGFAMFAKLGLQGFLVALYYITLFLLSCITTVYREQIPL